MRHTVLLLSLLLMFSAGAKTKPAGKVRVFAQTEIRNQGQIARGDSSAVTVYAYSTMPFANVQVSSKVPKVKGCHVRLLPQRNYRQSVTYIEQQPYYTVPCAQYMVSPTKNGNYKFPKIKINAVVMEEKEEDRSHRDPFFGPFSDFFRQPEYNHIKQSFTAPAQPFQVVNPPRKSSEQLRHEGKMLI